MAAPPTATREPLAERERKRERDDPTPQVPAVSLTSFVGRLLPLRWRPKSCFLVCQMQDSAAALFVFFSLFLWLSAGLPRFVATTGIQGSRTVAWNGDGAFRSARELTKWATTRGPRNAKKKIKKTKQQKKRLTQIDSSRPHCRRPATATATSCASRRRSITYGMIDRCRPAEKTRRPKSTSAAAKVSTARQSAAAEKQLKRNFLPYGRR